MYHVYILKSLINGKHYYGYTNDLKKRLSQHNNGESIYTKRYAPWILIHSEEFETRSEAMKREKFFKSGIGYTFLKQRGIL